MSKYVISHSQQLFVKSATPPFSLKASEKAIKGAQMARDSNQAFHGESLRLLCIGLDDTQLNQLAQELDTLTGSTSFMRYPNAHGFPKIPHDVIDESTASKALEIATGILARCEDLITLQSC